MMSAKSSGVMGFLPASPRMGVLDGRADRGMHDFAVAGDEQASGDLVGGVESSAPSVVRYASSAEMLREYAEDAARDIDDGRLLAPMSVTPLSVTIVVSATMPSTLPPCGPAARSTMTDPAPKRRLPRRPREPAAGDPALARW